MKYLVCWKRFIVENNIWEKEENLENTKKLVNEFEGKIEVEVRQKVRLEKVKLNPNIEKFRKSELSEVQYEVHI